MYDLLQNLISWFLGTGWMWVAGVLLLVLVIRLIWRRRTAVEDQLQPERPDRPRSDSEEADNQGLFGSLTPALAAQIPESEKETKDFGKILVFLDGSVLADKLAKFVVKVAQRNHHSTFVENDSRPL